MRWAWLPALALAACGPAPPIMEAPRGASLLEPLGELSMGLHYREVLPLGVRYRDLAGRPVVGGEVRFRIFGDPVGSTISRDSAITDGTGEARVQVEAGNEEAAFRVVASAADASDLEFAVAVSSQPFAGLAVELTAPPPPATAITRLVGLLYDDRPCANLTPAKAYPPPRRSQVAIKPPPATLLFQTLLARPLAVVVRGEDRAARLVAWGCVDLAAEQLQLGSPLVVRLPLARLRPSLGGSFAIPLTVDLPPARLPSWSILASCPQGPAQTILDGIVRAAGGTPTAGAITQRRGAADAQGCRPGTAGGQKSLDGRLQELIGGPGTPARQLPLVLADFEAMTRRAQLATRLTIAAVAPPGADPMPLGAGHTVDGVTLSTLAGRTGTYSPATLGVPHPTAAPITASLTDAHLALASYGLTLRLPLLWRRALGEMALVPRGLPATARGLLGTVVGAAAWTSGGLALTGCPAVAEAVCQQLGESPCALAPTCEQGLDEAARVLEAAFVVPSGLDFVVTAGSATAADLDGDLRADELQRGRLDIRLDVGGAKPLLLALPWSGKATP